MKKKSTFRKNANNYLTHTLKQKGITLIALVVTIVVLLILAGITISLILGSNSIFELAQNAKIDTGHSVVLEAMRLKLFNGNMETLDKKFDELSYLKNNNYINEDGVVNVSTFVEKPTSGKGTEETGDYYYVLEGSLYYKDLNKTETLLGKLFDVKVEETQDLPWIWHLDTDGKAVITGLNTSSFPTIDGPECTNKPGDFYSFIRCGYWRNLPNFSINY